LKVCILTFVDAGYPAQFEGGSLLPPS